MKTLSEVVEQTKLNSYNDNFESVRKQAMRYLQNIFKSVGVNISELRKISDTVGEKVQVYHLCDDLAKIIKDHIENMDFPTEKEIDKCINCPSELTKEVIAVIKLFLNDNFEEEVISRKKEKINRIIQKIIEQEQRRIAEVEDIVNSLESNKLSFLCCNNVRELLAIIEKNPYSLVNYTTDEGYEEICYNPHLTNEELMIIDFLRLDKLLSDMHKYIKIKNTIELLSR